MKEKRKNGSWLVTNSLARTLFPKLREQKPGKDFYNWIALTQFFIAIYIILFFS